MISRPARTGQLQPTCFSSGGMSRSSRIPHMSNLGRSLTWDIKHGNGSSSHIVLRTISAAPRLWQKPPAFSSTQRCSFALTSASTRYRQSFFAQSTVYQNRCWRANTIGRHVPRRSLFTEALPSVLVPPVVFTALFLTLWTYKCIMTVVFQNKIIYMPYMPPFTRSETVENYAAICRPIEWKSKTIRSLDGTQISICIGQHTNPVFRPGVGSSQRQVVICYFHGNGGSVPPRLPLLSGVLRAIDTHASDSRPPAQYTIVALSYRGYWTSSGRASQGGIEQDAQALLRWAAAEYQPAGIPTKFVLWGQSLGAGVASTAAATWISELKPGSSRTISGLILETPFTSIKGMLLALYPQRWLPYKYLWPFLWNHWDAGLALQRIAKVGNPPQILLLPATRDEVVPAEEADKLERLCRDVRLPTTRQDVAGALHTEATIRHDGQNIVADFIVRKVVGK